MLLAIDIGNTNVAIGLYRESELVHTFRVQTVRARTADEYAAALSQMVQLRGVARNAITAAIIASVVPPLTAAFQEAVRQAFEREAMVVNPGIKTGISIRYENTREVGADRIVNAVAAYERFAAGVIVVDFGTATTFDCISPRAEYLGGVIVPGIQVSLDGLLERAAKLSRIEIAAPPNVVGRTTTTSLQSGIVFGYASLVDGLVARLRNELDFECQVLATGGLAPLIAAHTETLEQIDEHLTLDGLRLLHERNARRRGA